MTGFGIDNHGSDIYLTFAPLFAVGSLYIAVLWLILVYKLFIKRQYEHGNEHIYWFYRVTALICFSTCLGCAIADTTHLYLCYINDYFMLGSQLKIVKAVADFFFFMASLSLNMILFGRVYYTFKDSHFALSKCTIFCIYIQIISSTFIDLAYCILVVLYGSNETKADRYVKPLVIALVINDLLVSISMLYLFSYKLKEVIIMSNTVSHTETPRQTYRKFKEISSMHHDSFQLDTDKHSVLSSGKLTINDATMTNHSSLITHKNSDSVYLDSIQLDTLVVVTRHTILSGFAIFFNQLYYGFNYISMRDAWENSYGYGLLVYGLRMVGMVGITTSLWFSMKFAKNTYFKCCIICHLTCYKCCIKCTKSTIKHTLSQKRIQK
eukprot:77076_1